LYGFDIEMHGRAMLDSWVERGFSVVSLEWLLRRFPTGVRDVTGVKTIGDALELAFVT
jgi:hypothetical protein